MSIQLIDSHCHLDCLDLTTHNGSLDAALNRARQEGVVYFLCVCINLQDFPQVLRIARTYPDISASVGLHPNERVDNEPTLEVLLQLADDEQIIAIGETGLDYFRSEGDLEWQRERFRTHIRAAKTLNKPLIIHSRDAKEDTLKIMQEEDAQEAGGVMHCFVEDWEMAQACMALNFYISFSGIVTFKNAQALQQVAKNMPLDRILIETDSPYLAPVPYRGKTNEPAYVRHVAEKLADLRGESIQSIAQQTTQNFKRLFLGL